MSNYFENISDELKQYYNILSDEIPDFLNEYINTPEMQHQNGISTSCGTVYSKLYDQFFYSRLNHSVAVALIIWNFTKDKKQTLSGLFHDISTPAFSHCIDFLNNDYEHQESTEGLTREIIENSSEIMKLLKRDNIKVEEIFDYHMYPIADNDTPRLSSDRLEYTLTNGAGVVEKIWGMSDIKEIYNNIVIYKNEDGEEEIGFKDIEIAEKFVNTMSQLSINYRREKTAFSMQFIVEILKRLFNENYFAKEDLYKKSEAEIINIIENCKDEKIKEVFKIWRDGGEVHEENQAPENRFYVSIEKNKIRYINPLVNVNGEIKRIMDVSDSAKADIDKALNYRTKKYIYMNFDF